jgi:hypothetical protein
MPPATAETSGPGGMTPMIVGGVSRRLMRIV